MSYPPTKVHELRPGTDPDGDDNQGSFEFFRWGRISEVWIGIGII
ncbi:hypothetical protein [Marinoscillum luteum]|uniref:Uncharacterized protein n=1 Tax=Marinoscillum luteum TaxID=861051 RepID=A0ABW7N9A5_9BACT